MLSNRNCRCWISCCYRCIRSCCIRSRRCQNRRKQLKEGWWLTNCCCCTYLFALLSVYTTYYVNQDFVLQKQEIITRHTRIRGKKDKKDIKKELTRGRKCDKITELFARETSGAAECTLKIKQRLTRKTLKLIWELLKKSRTVNFWKRKRSQQWRMSELSSENGWGTERCFDKIFREFDPGSGRTLAACLTHASRTKLDFGIFRDEEWYDLVADGWVTRE